MLNLGLVFLTEFHQVPNRLRSEKITWDAEGRHIRLRSLLLGSSLYRVERLGAYPVCKDCREGVTTPRAV